MRRMEGGRWSGLKRRGDLVGIVLNAPDAAAIRDILARIKD